MKDKLPGVFANKIDHKVNNNKEYSYGSEEVINDNNKEKNIEKIKNITLNVEQKINKIFSSSKYIYKIDVKIKTKDSEYTKRIIGKNNKNLITKDNELIPIDNIIDIEIVE